MGDTRTPNSNAASVSLETLVRQEDTDPPDDGTYLLLYIVSGAAVVCTHPMGPLPRLFLFNKAEITKR